MVWLAPVKVAVRGRSPVTAISGTWLCQASSSAGCRLAAAVPDVVTTGTGFPDALAMPSAKKAAVRSSIRTCSRSSPIVSASYNSYASGALRLPRGQDDLADAGGHQLGHDHPGAPAGFTHRGPASLRPASGSA